MPVITRESLKLISLPIAAVILRWQLVEMFEPCGSTRTKFEYVLDEPVQEQEKMQWRKSAPCYDVSLLREHCTRTHINTNTHRDFHK